MLSLWRAIRRIGRTAEEAPPAPVGPRPRAAVELGGSVALADTIVPDFPLANKSFGLSYAGNDL